MTARNTKSDRLQLHEVLNPHPERVIASEFNLDTFFDPRDIVQVKYEMLRRVSVGGVSRSTYYQAEQDFEDSGLMDSSPPDLPASRSVTPASGAVPDAVVRQLATLFLTNRLKTVYAH